MNVTALDKSLSSRFLPNSTLKAIVDELMVEQWNQSIMYDRYYNECQPIKCAYTYQTKNSIVYIVTTLLGLLGGLITVLKLIVPRVVMFVRKKKELIGPHICKI
jgi:beta-lactamase regulating signal transducer with metallopeptidase domain